MTAERSTALNVAELPEVYRCPYDHGARLADGKVCLDTGCGIGTLTNYMGTNAKSMIGIDYNVDAIENARRAFTNYASYQLMDCRKLEFADATFDVVLSFEFLEHLNEEDQHKYLREVIRVLKPGGVVCLSTPNRASTDKYNATIQKQFDNEWHLREMHEDELLKLLGQYFSSIQFFRTEPYFLCELRV